MNINKIFERPYYKSILFLTCFFYIEQNIPVRQLHYRWALMKDHDGINSTYFVNKMKKFQKYLDGLYFFKFIEKNCITSKSNLSNFLKKLVEFGMLKSINDDGIIKYIPTKKSQKIILQNLIIDEVKKMPWHILSKFATGFVNNNIKLISQAFQEYNEKRVELYSTGLDKLRN